MSDTHSRLTSAIADIDAVNADDPRRTTVDGVARPTEVVYAERMSACLARLYPGASDALRIAARAQHISRWQIPRASYPLGRDGYNAWRAACREHHATRASDIMSRRGYDATSIAHVAKIIRKEDLKRDPDSQALENVVAVVFVEHHLDEFIASHADYSDDKIVTILKKTLRKMDPVGHAALAGIALSERAARLVTAAVS